MTVKREDLVLLQAPDIRAHVESHYPDERLREAVLAEIAKHGTEERILKGELALPSLHDAVRFVTGEAAQEEEVRQRSRRG